VPLSQEEGADPKFLSRLWRCIQIGLLCVQESPDKRPDIEQVVEMLKTEGELLEPEEPTLREEGETSNARPEPEEPTLREEGERSNARPEPKEPTLREEGERSNARPEPEEPTFKVKHRTQGAKTMTSNAN